MTTKDAPNALAPVYIVLPTVTAHGTVDSETYLNTGLLTARDEEIIRSKPFKHRAARFVDGYGSLFMIPVGASLIMASMMWSMSRYAAPGAGPGFGAWAIASAVILAAMFAVRAACTRIVGKDGDRHEGGIATSVTVPDMLLAADLPSNIKELAAELSRHRTASQGLRAAPAFGAYTAALAAVATAAQAYANLDPDAAAALANTRLHDIPAVRALADKHAADLAAAKEAEKAAHEAVHAFSDATDDARVLAAVAAH